MSPPLSSIQGRRALPDESKACCLHHPRRINRQREARGCLLMRSSSVAFFFLSVSVRVCLYTEHQVGREKLLSPTGWHCDIPSVPLSVGNGALTIHHAPVTKKTKDFCFGLSCLHTCDTCVKTRNERIQAVGYYSTVFPCSNMGPAQMRGRTMSRFFEQENKVIIFVITAVNHTFLPHIARFSIFNLEVT